MLTCFFSYPELFYLDLFTCFFSYPELFYLDPVTGNISLLDGFWSSSQTMFALTAMVEDHGTPRLRSVVPLYVSTLQISV